VRLTLGTIFTASPIFALYGRGYAHQRLGAAEKSAADIKAAKLIDPKVADKLSKLGLLPLNQN